MNIKEFHGSVNLCSHPYWMPHIITALEKIRFPTFYLLVYYTQLLIAAMARYLYSYKKAVLDLFQILGSLMPLLNATCTPYYPLNKLSMGVSDSPKQCALTLTWVIITPFLIIPAKVYAPPSFLQGSYVNSTSHKVSTYPQIFYKK